MTGRRLLDVIALLKASRGVAAKHVALRQHQWDVYSKTSSLAKAIKSQTDRVTLTVKAASNLAKRFHQAQPDYSTQASQPKRSPQDASISRQDGPSGIENGSKKRGGLSQDDFYERPVQIDPTEPTPDSSLGIKQEKAKRHPLPDGSVFPADTADPADLPKQVKESYSEFPQTEPVKAPLADGKDDTDEGLRPTSSGRTSIPKPAVGQGFKTSEKDEKSQQQTEKQVSSQEAEHPPAVHSQGPSLQADRGRDVFFTSSSSDEQVVSAQPSANIPKITQDVQRGDEHVNDARIDQDVFYSSSSRSEEQSIPQAQAVSEQEQLSEEAYTEIFHSPRVARMLGGQPKSGKPSQGLEMHGAQEAPVEQTKLPQEKDKVPSSIRTLRQESQGRVGSPPTETISTRASQAKSNEDVHNLATDMAKDAEAMSADSSQINSVRHISVDLMLID